MKYAFTKYEPDTMARAIRRGETISFKQSVELARKLRGMRSDKAERFLNEVIVKKAAVPYTRFTDGAGHKRGMGPGKYPFKTATAFLQLLQQGVANAENKGLGTPLKLVSVVANDGNAPARHGRKRGRTGKSTHIELVLSETEDSQKAVKMPKNVKVKGVIEDAPKEAKTPTEAKPAKPEAKPAEKSKAKAEPGKPASKEAPAEPAPPKQTGSSHPKAGAKGEEKGDKGKADDKKDDKK